LRRTDRKFANFFACNCGVTYIARWILKRIHTKTEFDLISFSFLEKPILWHGKNSTFCLLSYFVVDPLWKKIIIFIWHFCWANQILFCEARISEIHRFVCSTLETDDFLHYLSIRIIRKIWAIRRISSWYLGCSWLSWNKQTYSLILF
jgi:hypothetical protein